MITLYLRKEPTTDGVLKIHAPDAKKFDVVAYRDPAASKVACRWPWHYSSRPTRRNRWVMFNCFRWKAVWLPATIPPKEADSA